LGEDRTIPSLHSVTINAHVHDAQIPDVGKTGEILLRRRHMGNRILGVTSVGVRIVLSYRPV